MCNWCINSMTLTSHDFSMLQNLHGKILACYNAADKNKNLVRDLLAAHGYASSSMLNQLTDRRDHISHCDKVLFKKDNLFMFSCETTTAWSENMVPISTLLAEQYSNKIKLRFQTEEPGSDVYLVSDETGVYYPDRFKTDYCFKGNYDTQYFQTFTEVVDYLKKSFPKADISCYDSISDIKHEVDKIYKNIDDEYFLNINKFVDYSPNERKEVI